MGILSTGLNFMVLDNASIIVVHKFQYLKSYLSGSAEKIIAALPLTEAKFSVAWQILCDRFSNEQLLIHNHVRAIFNIKSKGKFLMYSIFD